MKGVIVLVGIATLIISCGKKEIKPEKLNYSLLDKIYKDVETTDLKAIDLKTNDIKTLNVPKYIKVYRGSFKDSNGNVVEGGYEWLKIDSGEPDTNF